MEQTEQTAAAAATEPFQFFSEIRARHARCFGDGVVGAVRRYESALPRSLPSATSDEEADSLAAAAPCSSSSLPSLTCRSNHHRRCAADYLYGAIAADIAAAPREG